MGRKGAARPKDDRASMSAQIGFRTDDEIVAQGGCILGACVLVIALVVLIGAVL